MTTYDYEKLAMSTAATLEEVLCAGTAPAVEDLAGSEFRGWNTPFFASWVGILRFKKGFFLDPKAGGALRGYNKNIMSGGGINDPWDESGPGGKAKPFGFYDVVSSSTEPYSNSVVLNYNCPRNFSLDPTKLLRDYLVQVDPENPDLFLGKAYLALPPKWPCVSYFILERVGQAEIPS